MDVGTHCYSNDLLLDLVQQRTCHLSRESLTSYIHGICAYTNTTSSMPALGSVHKILTHFSSVRSIDSCGPGPTSWMSSIFTEEVLWVSIPKDDRTLWDLGGLTSLQCRTGLTARRTNVRFFLNSPLVHQSIVSGSAWGKRDDYQVDIRWIGYYGNWATESW